MNEFQGIALGALQGVAEFLPVSSSGHLKLAQKLFGLTDVPLLFDIILHLATLLAVIIFFRKKIWALLCAFGRLVARRKAPVEVRNRDGSYTQLTELEAVEREKTWRSYILAIVIATVITGILGLVSSKLLDEDTVPFYFIPAGFVITSFLLIVSGIKGRKMAKKAQAENSQPDPEAELKKPVLSPAKISWWQAIVIGLSQGVGTLPGISRSGSTISASVLSGISREDAGEFSFIVSIPAVLGAFLLELVKALKSIREGAESLLGQVGILPLVLGFVVAFVVGYLSLFLLMKIIKKGRLEWFAVYLIPLAIYCFACVR